MKLPKSIARKILKRKKRVSSVNKKTHNFKTAQTVAVLWSVGGEEAFQIIRKKTEEYNTINFLALYYNPEKKADISIADHFCEKQLNWWGFPKNGPAKEFLQKDYDMLIDLTVKKYFPVQILAHLAKASFKIGYSEYEDNPYDLNLDIHQQPESSYLAEQIIYYLNQIK